MTSIATQLAGIALAALAAVAAPAHANLVTNLVSNGGFETGDFSGWTATGQPSFDAVQCAGPGPTVAEGNCSAIFGSLEPSGITQSIAVGAGMVWSLSFALLPDGGMPSSFSVQFGGQTLLSLTDLAASDYQRYDFSGVAMDDDMALSFTLFDPVGFLSLDDVTVTAVPEPATTALIGAALASGLWLRRRRQG